MSRGRWCAAAFLVKAGGVWNELFPAEQARVVQLLVERVDVEEDALEVRIRADGLVSLIGSCDRAGRGKQHDGAR